MAWAAGRQSDSKGLVVGTERCLAALRVALGKSPAAHRGAPALALAAALAAAPAAAPVLVHVVARIVPVYWPNVATSTVRVGQKDCDVHDFRSAANNMRS